MDLKVEQEKTIEKTIIQGEEKKMSLGILTEAGNIFKVSQNFFS